MDKRTELAKLNKKLNVRLINAERRGLQETQSYKKLVALAKDVGTVSKTGKVRFKERTKSIKEEDLSKYIKQAKLALTVNGTVGKEWLKTKEIMKRFKKGGFNVSVDFIESYLEGKKSGNWKLMMQYYSSSEIVEMAQEAGGFDNLSNKFDEYNVEKGFKGETFDADELRDYIKMKR